MKITIPLSFYLNERNHRELIGLISEHFLGDKQCNKYVEGRGYVAKYPEKETPELLEAHRTVARGYAVKLDVEFDVTTGKVLNSKVHVN